MPANKGIESRGHIKGFQEEIAKVAGATKDSFFTWFDAARDVEASFTRGEWDFALHITPFIAPHISRPEDRTILLKK